MIDWEKIVRNYIQNCLQEVRNPCADRNLAELSTAIKKAIAEALPKDKELLLLLSEVHSGNAEEGKKIIDLILSDVRQRLGVGE